MRKKMEFKKLYYTLAITFLYFFLEITLFRIVKPIWVQKYWVIIPTLIYTVSKLYKKFEEKARSEKKVFSFGNTKVVAEKVEDEVIDLDNNETTSSEDVEIF